MPERRAELLGAGRRFAVVAARFNEFFTGHLARACLDELKAHGVKDEDVTLTWVPGSFELPLVCRRLAADRNVEAVISLGCIIRGETAHYDLVAAEAARGIADAARDTGVPIIFGVVTAENLTQAIERCGAKMGNRGAEAARAALEMANLTRRAP
jgi:6,7-dimethyl-8-ribityllumazine synthase